jgi:curved DNA-binding protein CbpA
VKNHYQILGLQNFASISEVRRAYRGLALKHHPDRGGDEEKMKEISNAYQFLLQNKERYDEQLRPRKPILVQTGFTIVVNGFGYGFENATSTWTRSF